MLHWYFAREKSKKKRVSTEKCHEYAIYSTIDIQPFILDQLYLTVKRQIECIDYLSIFSAYFPISYGVTTIRKKRYSQESTRNPTTKSEFHWIQFNRQYREQRKMTRNPDGTERRKKKRFECANPVRFFFVFSFLLLFLLSSLIKTY